MSLHEGFNHQKRNLPQPHQEQNCNCQQQQQSKIECNDNDPNNSGDGANDVNNENNHHNNSKIDDHEINNPHHMYYMDQALKIADQTALQVGEVPVGCVIVWQSSREQLDKIDNNAVATTTTTSNKDKENNNHNEGFGIIISHGANMVNATRDATRHAEIVAIDRLITAGNSSDALCLSRDVIRKSAHADIPKDSRLNDTNAGSGGASKEDFITTAYGCDYDDGKGWKKGYGWNNGRAYPVDILKECDLYVTVEPCIMVCVYITRTGHSNTRFLITSFFPTFSRYVNPHFCVGNLTIYFSFSICLFSFIIINIYVLLMSCCCSFWYICSHSSKQTKQKVRSSFAQGTDSSRDFWMLQ